MKLKREKIEVDDALNATRAAVQEGVIVGGGTALVQAAKKLDKVKTENPDQEAGVKIVARALEAPLRQIAENAGVDGSVVAGKIRSLLICHMVSMRKLNNMVTCLNLV